MKKNLKPVFALLIIVTLLAASHGARAQQGGAESVTLTLERAVMPVTIYHPGLLCAEPEVVTVYDFTIRDYLGMPIDSFIIQKASARVEVPIESVREIRQIGWISKNTLDIEGIGYVAPVVITLTDGREVETLMNADFGTVEGLTEKGCFFLGDPHTVTRFVFDRDTTFELLK